MSIQRTLEPARPRDPLALAIVALPASTGAKTAPSDASTPRFWTTEAAPWVRAASPRRAFPSHLHTIPRPPPPPGLPAARQHRATARVGAWARDTGRRLRAAR